MGLTLYFSFFFIVGFHLGSCVQPPSTAATPEQTVTDRFEQFEEAEDFDGGSPLFDENMPVKAPASRAPGRSVPFVPQFSDEDSAELVG